MSGEAGAVGSVVLNAPVKCCFRQNKLIVRNTLQLPGLILYSIISQTVLWF